MRTPRLSNPSPTTSVTLRGPRFRSNSESDTVSPICGQYAEWHSNGGLFSRQKHNVSIKWPAKNRVVVCLEGRTSRRPLQIAVDRSSKQQPINETCHKTEANDEIANEGQ